MRKVIMMLMCIIFIQVASAISEGQNFTQSQINGLNLESITYSYLDFRPENYGRLSQGVYSHDFSYLNVIKQNSSTYPYTVIREYTSLSAPRGLIEICFIIPSSCQSAQASLIDFVSPQRQQVLLDVRERVFEYQHTTQMDAIESWILSLFPGS